MFKITESVVALYVRKTPIGNKIYDAAHIPANVPKHLLHKFLSGY